MSDKRTLSREEEAARDLTSTRWGRGAALLLTAGFVLSLLAVPLLEWLGPRFLPPAPGARPAPDFRFVPSSRTLPIGADFQRLETHLEDSSAVWRKLRPPVQAELTRWGQNGNSQVVVGPNGWLFYRQAVDHLTGPGFLDRAQQRRRRAAGGGFPDPVFGIQDFAAQLKKRGIRLIVMPVPVKAAIYPDKLWPGYDIINGPLQNPSLELFKRRLEARGIPVFDATETLWRARRLRRWPQFFPTDTHWTPAGAALCARALGDFVELWGDLPPRTRATYEQRVAGGVDAADLVRLLGLPAAQTLYPPHPEPALEVTQPGGGLAMPRRDGDVLLIGDSFAGAYAGAGAGLSAHLARALGRPVDVLSVHNGGSWATRRELQRAMKAGDDRLAGKKVVIYEFTARDLSWGNWIPFKLPTPAEIARIKPRPTPPPAAAPAASVVPGAAPAPAASRPPAPSASPAPRPSAAPAPVPSAVPRPVPAPRFSPVQPRFVPRPRRLKPRVPLASGLRAALAGKQHLSSF